MFNFNILSVFSRIFHIRNFFQDYWKNGKLFLLSQYTISQSIFVVHGEYADWHKTEPIPRQIFDQNQKKFEF